jgi:beta-1,4-N-acetylglucosaminyltransferase
MSSKAEDKASGRGGMEKHCLVTIGATAKFTSLLEEVIQATFLKSLQQKDFTHLNVQCGTDLGWFISEISAIETHGIKIEPFDFMDDLTQAMLRCRAEPRLRRAGIVISHAGEFRADARKARHVRY